MNTAATQSAPGQPAPVNNGNMKIILGILAIVFGLIFLVVGTAIISYVSAANNGNRFERGLEATKMNNENIYAQYGQKVAEAAQVPAMYRDDLQKLVTAAIQGRYGADGSKAVFQAIQEQNPTLDPKLYQTLQQIIVAGRNEFQTAQTRLVDQKRVYETQLGYVWSGFWLRLAGYPKINLADFKPVTTDAAAEVFKTGKERGPIQIAPK